MKMGEKIRFDKGEMSDSDSENEYSEGVRKMLASTRKKGKSEIESEDELYAFSDSGSDSNDDQHNAESDIEGAGDDDDLPDKKAWGRHKGAFYSTDYVDQDYGGFTEQEEKIAEREEIEARAIQERLAKELDDQDFTLDIFHKKSEPGDEVEQTFVKADLSNLSQRQKQQLFSKESPEFAGLVDDFKDKMDLLHKYLMPIKKLHNTGSIKPCLAIEFVLSHHNLILNYCNNILFYLLLKSKRLSIQNHPVVKRLYQYRQLIVQLDPIFEEVIQPQIIQMLAEENADATTNSKKLLKTNTVKKSKKLKLLKTVDVISKSQKRILDKKDEENDQNGEPEEKLMSTKKRSKLDLQDLQSSTEDENEDEINTEIGTANTEDGKRAITYQIAKNKGLMPKRKKEQRNPRVKHRNKFRKAKIRRKGAIREVRTETSRYGGEMSGIKASVKKSIKIK